MIRVPRIKCYWEIVPLCKLRSHQVIRMSVIDAFLS